MLFQWAMKFFVWFGIKIPSSTFGLNLIKYVIEEMDFDYPVPILVTIISIVCSVNVFLKVLISPSSQTKNNTITFMRAENVRISARPAAIVSSVCTSSAAYMSMTR